MDYVIKINEINYIVLGEQLFHKLFDIGEI